MRRLSLSTQTLLLQLGIVLLTLLVAAAASLRLTEASLHEQYGERALAIAQAVATLPSVRDSFDDADPSRSLQPLAEAVRQASGMSFVVIANAEGIRYAHPNPGRIGERLSTDPGSALAGQSGIFTETGTLGTSVRGKVPVFDADGDVVGVVSVGVLIHEVAARVRGELPEILLSVGLALTLGAIGSWLLARRVQRQTFGLEPGEIATLYEHREAMLLGIREGVVAVGRDGRIALVNAEARRLLRLDESCRGRAMKDVIPPGRVRQLLSGEVDGTDQVAVAGDRVLVVNRMPVRARDEVIGAVVTLRDRTELEELLRELDTVSGLADALRAQAHEFSNRLHTVVGLIELGRPDEAVRFITEASTVHQALSEALVERIGDSTLVALLIAKAAVASERGIDLRLADDAVCVGKLDQSGDLVTVVGNLIDNALDAVGTSVGERGWVEVSIKAEADKIEVRVHDSGPGVDPALRDEVFREGFTTKIAGSGARRGLGLALVSQVIRRRRGRIELHNDGGAVFTVVLPREMSAHGREEALTR